MYHSEQVYPGFKERKKEHKPVHQRDESYVTQKEKFTIISGRVVKERWENEMDTGLSELRGTETECVKGMAVQNKMI